MASDDIQAVRAFLASLPRSDNASLAERRERYDRAKNFFALPPGTSVEKLDAAGVLAERIRLPASRADRVVLYFHGGGYVIGSPDSHRHLAAAIAEAAEATVLLPDYGLAPEHPFPAAVEDALAVYRWLIDGGQAAQGVVLAGDSAGGGLAVAAMMAARERSLALPAAAALISPWVDLGATSESIDRLAARDPIVTKTGLLELGGYYLAGRDPRTPLASPLWGDLRGLPRLLIQVGSDEVLLDDACELDRRARAQGVKSTLEVWPDMIHVWHWFYPQLREGREAIQKLGAFVRSATG